VVAIDIDGCPAFDGSGAERYSVIMDWMGACIGIVCVRISGTVDMYW
jgi:hypothetical protein